MSDSIPVCAAPDPEPRAPSFPVPEGACDTHFHVFGPAGYTLEPGRRYTPPDAPLSAFRRVSDALGVRRAVLVHPSVYGTDNAITLDCLAAHGSDPGLMLRGIAVVDNDIPDTELERMNDLGVRGLRYNLLFPGGPPKEQIEAMATRIRAFGWHIQLLIDVSVFDLDIVAGLPVDVVFDHLGHMSPGKGLDDPGFQRMLAMMRDGRAWVKLSGAYRTSANLMPPWDDVLPIGRALVETAPDQCVWATDWPHPGFQSTLPNDGSLMDVLADWAPDDRQRQAILVDNPARLYGF